MSIDLLINAAPYEVRIALAEFGNLVELYLERPAEKRSEGNIYRGKVMRVLPGMQAAFVDIGLARTGFLYVDDAYVGDVNLENHILKKEACGDVMPLESLAYRSPGMNIDDLLTEGQDILVQICKEPIGSKGARLTCHITLPCRNLVFMPMTDHIGISRKIEAEDIRQQLRQTIEEIRPRDAGFIVRTVGENASRENLEADMEYLLHLWSEIQDRAAKSPIPSLIYEDLDITLRAVRDLFTPEVKRVVIDEPETCKNVINFVETFAPHLKDRIQLYTGAAPLFDAYGVEVEVKRALDKKVWLRSGGYIIIEATEALTVIDVNTGRYVGKTDLEDTIFTTNLEAVKEIAYQLRLRNIGGIIIIDFIDMENETHREEVFNALQEAAKNDKNRINILRLSEFGLVQMTRKRNRTDLWHAMCEPCPCCAGQGLIKSRQTICYEIFRKISRDALKFQGRNITIKVSAGMASLMLKEEAATIDNLEKETGKRLTIIPADNLYNKKYEIIWEDQQKEA